jgi:hypothetical protein
LSIGPSTPPGTPNMQHATWNMGMSVCCCYNRPAALSRCGRWLKLCRLSSLFVIIHGALLAHWQVQLVAFECTVRVSFSLYLQGNCPPKSHQSKRNVPCLCLCCKTRPGGWGDTKHRTSKMLQPTFNSSFDPF